MEETSAGIPVRRLASVDSTSLLARREVAGGKWDGAPVVIVAETQTGGVGRLGRAWASPKGGLWCTLVLPAPGQGAGPAFSNAVDGMGLRIGLACVKAVERAVGPAVSPKVGLKWPNDVLIAGAKVLGVLAEVVRGPVGAAVLVGVGVNANVAPTEFPPGLRRPATSLHELVGHDVDLDTVLDHLVTELVKVVPAQGLPVEIHAGIAARLVGVGEPVEVVLPTGDTILGTLRGLDRQGRMMVDRPDAQGGAWTAPPGAEIVGSGGLG